MNHTTLTHNTFRLSLLALCIAPLTALAAPPSGSAYDTDAQNVYVSDATSDGIANVNMILCIMDSMELAEMVNDGAYTALVDMNECDTIGQASATNSSSGSSGASSTPDYVTAVVNVTRASNSAPMLGSIWMSMTEDGEAVDVYIHSSATQAPADNPPYGQFRLDYIGKSSDTTLFNGFIEADGADLKYLENGPGSSDTSLALDASSTSAGAGTMTTWDSLQNAMVTFNFAYDSDETDYGFPEGVFRRFNTSTGFDECFDRSLDNADTSVWSYGTYNATTGARVDQANPGFPVLASYGGNRYYGFAGYWGIDFQGLDLSSFSDGVLANVSVSDQRPDNDTTYTLSKNSGKLTQWTRQQATLADMDGIPFLLGADLTGITDDATLTTGTWQIKWDDSNQQFIVTGMQTCDSSGCLVSTLDTSATVTAGSFRDRYIWAWAEAFGGNINIPWTTNAAHGSDDEVDYYTRAEVIPGDAGAPATLYCLSNCPTADSLSAFTGDNSPYGNNTDGQWGKASSSANTVSYGFGSTGLTESGTVLQNSEASLYTGEYQSGIQSGRLFESALTLDNCPTTVPGPGYVCEPALPEVYYTWQTGPNSWNQHSWLTDNNDSSIIEFDAPENIAYTVPDDSEYGEWAGKTIQLQFNGFGSLQGIPNQCVSPTRNNVVDCATGGARYVPVFALPDDTTMALASNDTALIIKALSTEVRLANVACNTTDLARPDTEATLPTETDLHDPSDPDDTTYIGIEPELTDTPKVIGGVIQ